MSSLPRHSGRLVILVPLVMALASPPWLHPRLGAQTQKTLAFPWVQICSLATVTFVNLETGERRERPAQPGDPASQTGCHGALCRRQGSSDD